MFQLTIGAALAYVRKALDEIVSVEEIGLLVSPDAVDLGKLVEGSIVEAVVKTHSQAPSVMIDGVKAEHGAEKDYIGVISEDGVITVTMKKDTLRIASVKAVDSEVVVCDIIPEDSAEGRKQLSKYVRGVPDDPRVVLQKTWADSYKPVLKYYTCLEPIKPETVDMTETIDMTENTPPPPDIEDIPSIDLDGYSPLEIYFVPYPKVEDESVMICPKLEYAVLNELTAMVLDSLSEHDKASLYREKAVKYTE